MVFSVLVFFAKKVIMLTCSCMCQGTCDMQSILIAYFSTECNSTLIVICRDSWCIFVFSPWCGSTHSCRGFVLECSTLVRNGWFGRRSLGHFHNGRWCVGRSWGFRSPIHVPRGCRARPDAQYQLWFTISKPKWRLMFVNTITFWGSWQRRMSATTSVDFTTATRLSLVVLIVTEIVSLSIIHYNV